MNTYRITVSVPWLPPPKRLRFTALVNGETQKDAELELREWYAAELHVPKKEVKVLDTQDLGDDYGPLSD